MIPQRKAGSPAGLILAILVSVLCEGSLQARSLEGLLAFEEHGRSSFVMTSQSYTATLGQSLRVQINVTNQELPADSRFVMRFVGASLQSLPLGEGHTSVVRHYRNGTAAQARFRYERLRYPEAYPSTDIVFRQSDGDLEYEVVLNPGADPGRVQLQFEGVPAPELAANGDLRFEARGLAFRLRKPSAFQNTPRGTRPVLVSFAIRDGTVGFELGSYDASASVFIDPVLSYSAYVGGDEFDAAYAIAKDASGNVYVTGETGSPQFPSSIYAGSRPSDRDVFITKMDSAGSILYTTILGGSGNDVGRAIALDSGGNIYVGGSTGSSNFPVTLNPIRSTAGGQMDGFILRLDSIGRLSYSSYIGGAGDDSVTGVAVDGSSRVYLAGYTNSTNLGTTANVMQATAQGSFDGFVMKLDLTVAVPLYSTFAGGSGYDVILALAITPSGSACVTGFTESTNLSAQAGFVAHGGGGGDAYTGCLNSSGSSWKWITALGGSSRDEGHAIAADTSENVYIAGMTASYDFPSAPGFLARPSVPGSYDAFVVKIDPSGGIIYRAIAGGSGSDLATSISIDSAGEASVGGMTDSVDLPLMSAYQSVFGGIIDGFALHFSPDGTSMTSGTFFGGTSDDRIYGVISDSSGNLIVTGGTFSSDLPVSNSPATAWRGKSDAFVSKLSTFSLRAVPGVSSLSPSSVIVGSSGVNLSVNGNAFVVGSTVRWNGSDRPTTFVSGSKLTAFIGPNDLASATTAQVTVYNPAPGGGTSTALPFSIAGQQATSFVFLQNDAINGVAVWGMGWAGGASILYSPMFYSVTPNWRILATADFDRNGATDLVLQNQVTNEISIWYLSGAQGTTLVSAPVVGASAPGWAVVGAADFDRDGTPDLLLQNTFTNSLSVWFMGGPQGSTVLSAPMFATPLAGWIVRATGDFDRNGFPDIVLQNQSTNAISVWYMGGPNGLTRTAAPVIAAAYAGWKVKGTADLNQDGIPDIILQNDSSNAVSAWYMSGPTGATLGATPIIAFAAANWKVTCSR